MLKDTFDAADGSRYEVPLFATSDDVCLVSVPEKAVLTDDETSAEVELWCEPAAAAAAILCDTPSPNANRHAQVTNTVISRNTALGAACSPAAPLSSQPTPTGSADGYQTALVLLLEDTAADRVQAIRRRFDAAHVERWPAHVTLVYPFVPATELADMYPALAAACASHSAFDMQLASFGHFAGRDVRRGYTTWLRPQPVAAVASLHAALTAALKPLGVPCKRLGQAHCTVARGQAEPQDAVLARDWQPLNVHVASVVVLQRAGATRTSAMREVARFALGRSEHEHASTDTAATDAVRAHLVSTHSTVHIASVAYTHPALAYSAAEATSAASRGPASVVHIAVGDGASPIAVRLAPRHVDGSAALSLKLAYAELRINQLCNNMVALQRESVEQVQALLAAVGRVFGVRGLSREERGRILLQRMELQERLDQLHALVAAKGRRQATRDDPLVSRMSDLRFQGQLRARRTRALQRRAAGNAQHDSTAAQLAALPPYSHSASGALMGGAEALAFYTCTMTCATVVELMEEGPDQVLGLGLAVRRPEAVVDSPTLIHIDRVSGTLLARDALLDAIAYKLPEAADDGNADSSSNSSGDAASVHGGFDMRPPEEAHATVGCCREPINAWLPLYVCAQHWARVRVLLPATLGYLCCLDPLAFHEYQYDVPLVVLGALAGASCRPGFGEHDARLFFAVQRTVRATMDDACRLQEHVHARLHAFVCEPDRRLKHHLTSLLTVLGALLVADPAEARAVLDAGFFTYVRHEALRRALGALLKERSPAVVQELLDRLLFAAAGESVLPADQAAAPLSAVSPVRRAVTPSTLTAATGDNSPLADETHATGADTMTTHSVSDDNGRANDTVTGPSAKQAMQLAATLPHELNRAKNAALQQMGLRLRGALPGPNIARKSAEATRAVHEWWNGRLEAARVLVSAESAGSSASLKPSAGLTATQTALMSSLLTQVLGCVYPTFGQIEAVERVATAWLDLAATPGSTGFYDSLPPKDATTHLRRVVVVPARHPATQPAGQTFLDAFGNNPLLLRAALVHAVRLHSNSLARAAATQPDLADPCQPDFAVRAAAGHVSMRVAATATTREAHAVHLRTQMALQRLVEENNLDRFVCLLVLATAGQRDGAYHELLELMLAHPGKVPLLTGKLDVMLTGRLKDKSVFARGNSTVPSGPLAAALRTALGDAAYLSLRTKILGCVSVHVYREVSWGNNEASREIGIKTGFCGDSVMLP